SAIFTGEIRAFTAFGKPLAWCLKKPAAGNYLANTRAGAVLCPYKPTASEEARIKAVAAEVLGHGGVFIGFDGIGGVISEINLTSPRLLVGDGDAEEPYYKEMAALISADLSTERR